MRDSSTRVSKSLRVKRLKAEQDYLVLLFYCLSSTLSLTLTASPIAMNKGTRSTLPYIGLLWLTFLHFTK